MMLNIKVSPKRFKDINSFSNISSTNVGISSTEIFEYCSPKQISLNNFFYWIAQQLVLKIKVY